MLVAKGANIAEMRVIFFSLLSRYLHTHMNHQRKHLIVWILQRITIQAKIFLLDCLVSINFIVNNALSVYLCRQCQHESYKWDTDFTFFKYSWHRLKLWHSHNWLDNKWSVKVIEWHRYAFYSHFSVKFQSPFNRLNGRNSFHPVWFFFYMT